MNKKNGPQKYWSLENSKLRKYVHCLKNSDSTSFAYIYDIILQESAHSFLTQLNIFEFLMKLVLYFTILVKTSITIEYSVYKKTNKQTLSPPKVVIIQFDTYKQLNSTKLKFDESTLPYLRF